MHIATDLQRFPYSPVHELYMHYHFILSLFQKRVEFESENACIISVWGCVEILPKWKRYCGLREDISRANMIAHKHVSILLKFLVGIHFAAGSPTGYWRDCPFLKKGRILDYILLLVKYPLLSFHFIICHDLVLLRGSLIHVTHSASFSRAFPCIVHSC